MLNRYITNKRKLPTKLNIPRRSIETPTTGSLSSVSKPSDIKYFPGTKSALLTNKISKQQKLISTSSLENIVEPSDVKNTTDSRTSIKERKFINTNNIINDFHNEILQYSARYIKKQIDSFDSENNTITLSNTLLDYGTEGPSPENFEVIVNGIHSPGIYTINQNGNDVVIQFTERLFSYDGLEKENVIVIGKLLEIGLEIETDEIGLTDENGEPLIL